jgi:hypothetical protein
MTQAAASTPAFFAAVTARNARFRTPRRRAHRGEHLDHVPYQVIGGLFRAGDQHPPTLRGQRRVKVLHAKARQPVPVLHGDHHRRRVRQNPAQLRPLAVQPGTDLAHHLRHRKALPRDPLRHPGHLPVQVGALIV